MKKVLMFLLPFLLLLSSCAKAPSAPEPDQTENVMAGLFTTSGSDDPEATSPPGSDEAVTTSETTVLTYDDIQAAYPEKTVLTWAVYPFFGLAESVRVEEVNAYLDSLGKDYAVFFTPTLTNGLEYWKTSLEEWGENIDIISGASIDTMIFCGYFSDITDYMSTDAGQKLYSLMPENCWKACGDGDRIFAVGNPLNIVSLSYMFDYNAEIAEKYNYDTEKSPLEQLGILKEIKSKENLSFVLPRGFESISNFTNVRMLELPLYWDAEVNEIRCVFDNPEYIDRVRTVCELEAEDLKSSNQEVYFAKASRETLPDEDTEGYIRDIQTDGVTLKEMWYCSGVTPISQTPDKAFDLLATVFTDPYLNNLLTYGIEGVDYNAVDGRADGTYNIWGETAFANSLICLPNASQPKDLPERLRNGIESAEPDDALTFRIDRRSFIDKLSEISEYVIGFSDEVTGENFDETVAEYRKKLFDAGLQDIIDDVNRQYAEWRSKQ